jgi:hypothetical protein
MTGVYVLDEQPKIVQRIEPSRLRAAADSVCRVAALGVGGGLNVLGWMVVFDGPWRIGLWIVVLSTELLAVVLWDSETPRSS